MQLIHPEVTRRCEEKELYESLLPLDGASVLELGCGKAEHTRTIARAHPRAHILAAEVDRLQHAKNLSSEPLPNLRFADFGAQAIPLEDSSLDVVMMFKSLHHVPLSLQDQALREIHRVLAPRGLLYVSEPVFAGPYNEIVRVFNDEEVVRRAAFDALQRAVQNRLFELESETFFLLPVYYRDFAEFEKKHFQVTYAERRVSEEQRAEVARRFSQHLGPDGVKLGQQVRIDLLRKSG